MPSNINLIHGDCLEYMKKMKDKEFDLAICDPPYGIGCCRTINIKNNKRSFWGKQIHASKEWDFNIPPQEYFEELSRVTSEQVIWGGNYFIEYLMPTKSWIFWHKKETETQGSNFSDGEMAWTSIKSVTRYFKYGWIGIDYCNKNEKKIHPTQKPVALYKWLLKNYAKPGDKILDTHGGSCSLAVACYDMGFDATIYEIDKDYFDAASKRLDNHKKQLTLF